MKQKDSLDEVLNAIGIIICLFALYIVLLVFKAMNNEQEYQDIENEPYTYIPSEQED